MKDWWLMYGLEVTGRDARHRAARERVLQEYRPFQFRQGPDRIPSREVEKRIWLLDREAARRTSSWTAIQAALETLSEQDAVPDDVWEAIARELGPLGDSANTDTPGQSLTDD